MGIVGVKQFSHESIVPDEDPLLKNSILAKRIVHAEIHRDFDIQAQVLGTGYSGAVRLAEHKLSRQQVAVKQFSKRRLKPQRLRLLKSEVEVYLRLDHPNICRLLHAYEGHRKVWLVMEMCSCELYTRLCQKKVYCEQDAAEVMRQMLQAVNYLHRHNIVHRDLKLENWMYGSEDRLKLIDFGFSEIFEEDELLQMPCGTLHYTSPEVISRSYSSKCDLWSMGVICYMLLMGRPPFRGSTNAKIAKAIQEAEIPLDGRWACLSLHAQDFIQSLLQKDPARRLNAAEALDHRWLKLGQAPVTLGSAVLKSLRTFAQSSHLRRAALTMLAYSLTSSELEGLEQTFLDLDTRQNGTITTEQLMEAMRRAGLEVSSAEVTRIFQRFDFSENEEIQYTPFVAALLETRVKLHEDKVRSAFEAFDVEGKGYITAGTLVQVFNTQMRKGTPLAQEEAEQWIREVDFKGNGVVDYPSFLAAMMGKNLRTLPSQEELAARPTLRIYEDCSPQGRPRGFTESFASTTNVRRRLADAILDCDEGLEVSRGRSRSFDDEISEKVQIRSLACDVDERYFT